MGNSKNVTTYASAVNNAIYAMRGAVKCERSTAFARLSFFSGTATAVASATASSSSALASALQTLSGKSSNGASWVLVSSSIRIPLKKCISDILCKTKRPVKYGARKIRFFILLSSGLYRRYGNFTRSGTNVLRRLYCRWRIALRPKEYSITKII